MAGKAVPLRLGPFTGGLSTYSDPSSITDNECAVLTNFDIDLDGSLVGRPPIVALSSNATAGKFDQRILGKYTTAGDISYIMLAATGAATNYLIAYNIATGVYTVVTSGTTVKFTAMIKYINKAWFICDPSPAYTGSGGSWDGTTWTAVPTMAKGATATLYKERIFVGSGVNSANPSRVQMSGPGAAINAGTWNLSTDFFDVANGDGQPITKIYSHNGVIAIFKKNSTYSFSYDTAPTKGQVQVISSTIGIDGIDCLTESQGTMYVMHDSQVYSISNWTWQSLNTKVPLKYVNSHVGRTLRNTSLSMLGLRLICRYYDSLYVYGTNTRVWSLWIPNGLLTPDFWVRSPVKDPTTGDYSAYYAGNYLTSSDSADATRLYKFQENYTSTDKEFMTCEYASKIYSSIAYGAKARVYIVPIPYTYKRLMWWGVDVKANSPINATIFPVAYGIPVRWKDISDRNLTWANRANYTWGNPLDIAIVVTDSANVRNLSGIRTFIKYVKSLRFRQIQFRLRSDVDGSTDTGPFTIFSITAFIVNKETVDKKIN